MAFSEVNDRAAVLKAVQEFDRLGRHAFLEKYGFGKARDYLLVSVPSSLSAQCGQALDAPE